MEIQGKQLEGSSSLNFEAEVDLDAIKSGKVGAPPAQEQKTQTDLPPVEQEPPAPTDNGAQEPAKEPVKEPEKEPEKEPVKEPETEPVKDESDLEEGVVDLSEPKGEEKGDEKEKGEEPGFITFGDQKVPVDTVKDELIRLKSIEDAIMQDEFLLGFIKHYDAGGDPAEFVNMVKTDYDKMDDISILRDEFYKKNSYIDAPLREKMFANEMKKKYGYDVINNEFIEGFDEDEEPDILKAKLQWEAKKLKAERVEEQKKFKSKTTKGPIKEVPDYSEVLEKRKKQIGENQHTKNFSESGLIPVSVDDVKFGIKVKDPEKIINMAVDTADFAKSLGITKDGMDENADLMKFFKVAAMAADPEGYEKKLISIGRTLERRDRMKESKNLQNLQGGQGDRVPQEKKESPKKELLKAFIERGEDFVL